MESTVLIRLHSPVKCMQTIIVESTRLCVAEDLWSPIPRELVDR